MNCVSQIACPIEVHKTRWFSNRLVDTSNTMHRGLMSTGEPVMKTYALHLYCQQVGFVVGHMTLKMRCRNTALELICSMSVSVNTSLYLLGRNIWTGAAPSSLTERITVGPKRVINRFARRMRYLRFTSNSETETVVSHVTHQISG